MNSNNSLRREIRCEIRCENCKHPLIPVTVVESDSEVFYQASDDLSLDCLHRNKKLYYPHTPESAIWQRIDSQIGLFDE